MQPALRARFDRLEERKARLYVRLDGLSDEVVNRSPADGGWSVIQVLAHMSRAEDLSLRYIRKKMRADAPPAGLGSALRSAALSLALRSPLKFKAPPMSAEVPERARMTEVAASWDVVRRDLEQALDALPPEIAHRAVFRHPRAGMMSLDQALRFMEDHFDHHLKQVERVLAAVV